MSDGDLESRKAPKQERARAKVAAILDATVRVLLDEGYDRASTNRIAREAGVSVGSLYQYFPNKEALVLAVARRHSEHMMAVLSHTAAELTDAPVERAVASFVRSMLAAHRVEPELHRVLVQQVLHLGLEHLDSTQNQARAIVLRWLEHRREDIVPRDLEAAAFVLVASVQAVTHGAVLYEPARLADGSLEAELVALVCRYLGR